MKVLENIAEIILGTIILFIISSILVILLDACFFAVTNYSIIRNIIHPLFRGLFG